MHPKHRIHADPDLPDRFDQLPDSLVLDIFNRLADVRSLGRCSAVSKRFSSLVPLVHDVCVKIDRVVTVDADDGDDSLALSSTKSRGLFAHLVKLMLFAVLKPFGHLRSAGGAGKPLVPQLAHHSPAQVLKMFASVRNLRVELPAADDAGTEDGVLLKWRAEFGSTLQSCVIVGGTKVEHKSSSSPPLEPVAAMDEDSNGTIPDTFYTNGGLKLRVVWTISSLIAASTRHYLLRPIIEDHPTIKSLVLTDADGQGTLIMGAEQLRDFRENPVATSAASNRTQVPASNMKLRYAPVLELPGGMVLQGATLVTIRPSEETNNGFSKREADSYASAAFDEPLKAAVKALLKRRTYLLEMNGF